MLCPYTYGIAFIQKTAQSEIVIVIVRLNQNSSVFLRMMTMDSASRSFERLSILQPMRPPSLSLLGRACLGVSFSSAVFTPLRILALSAPPSTVHLAALLLDFNLRSSILCLQ